MAAEVCLLLMQSLTGDCDTTIPTTVPTASVTVSQSAMAEATNTTAGEAIAPISATTVPQFADLCLGENARRLAVCVLPSRVREQWTMPRKMAEPLPPSTTATSAAPAPETAPPSNLSSVSKSSSSAPSVTAATRSAATPVALELPRSQPTLSFPSIQAPQFSAPTTVAARRPQTLRTPLARRRPQSGAQLYRQRQLALQSGRSYTRLSPAVYADQWQRTQQQQPTYQDWKRLLAQEAQAIAGGQGHNRLEVVVSDSFGLWLPPEMLPRDRLWLNQSISGDTTAGILQRVETFANTRATTIHLMAGANDLKQGVPVATIVSNLRRTIRLLQQQHPEAEIVLYSVLPTRRADIANDRVRSLNAQLGALGQQARVSYRDIYPWFQDAAGALDTQLTTDGLHLNVEGYALWQRALLTWAL